MIENAVLRTAFLQGDCPNPGVSYALNPGTHISLPLAGVCVALTHDEVLHQYVSVYRLVLGAECNSTGLIMKAGTVVYLRVHSDTPPLAEVGKEYAAGHLLTRSSPRLQKVTLALRVGGKGGIAFWDQGLPRAVLDHPMRQGYGYPDVAVYLRRAVALRFVDPAILDLAYPYPYRIL